MSDTPGFTIYRQDEGTTWYCAAGCEAAAVTRTSRVPWHACPNLDGAVTPLVVQGAGARAALVARDDYVGAEIVQTGTSGRPLAAVDIERPDGSNDRIVYAPTATAAGD